MRKNKKAITFLRQKSYLIAAGLMLAAVFGMTGVYVSEQRAEKEQAQIRAAQEEEQRMAESQKEETTPVDQVIKPKNTDFMDEPEVIAQKDKEDQTQNEEETQQPEEETQPQAEETAVVNEPELHFDAASDLSWPLQGNVIMNYSMDQTVYFATLDQYKYNPAIVIQGNVNDKILSVAQGKVANIETNEVTGGTVTVDLGDGYSAVYGQLKEIPLHAGDYVEAGDIIGYINEPTKYYSLEGANLYFQLLKDNGSVDPMEYLQ